MKNEKGTIFIRNKKGGLYGTPFQATTWAVEIHEIYPDRFKWVACWGWVPTLKEAQQAVKAIAKDIDRVKTHIKMFKKFKIS
jgi:hypothetical protein